jgi:hypothetical protein
LIAPDKTNVVLIDSSQTWAGGLARALRTHHKDVRLLILADPARLIGYVIYDYDHFVENAGENQVIRAIEAAAADQPLVNF